VNEKTQLQRLIKRDNIERDIALMRIKMQIPIKEKLKYANYVISNEGQLGKTWEVVKKVYKELKEIKQKC
jgi:dephospho-CoA kinase